MVDVTSLRSPRPSKRLRPPRSAVGGESCCSGSSGSLRSRGSKDHRQHLHVATDSEFAIKRLLDDLEDSGTSTFPGAEEEEEAIRVLENAVEDDDESIVYQNDRSLCEVSGGPQERVII